jgi:hypothetical protein
VHPPEADDPRSCAHPRQAVRDGPLIHTFSSLGSARPRCRLQNIISGH